MTDRPTDPGAPTPQALARDLLGDSEHWIAVRCAGPNDYTAVAWSSSWDSWVSQAAPGDVVRDNDLRPQGVAGEPGVYLHTGAGGWQTLTPGEAEALDRLVCQFCEYSRAVPQFAGCCPVHEEPTTTAARDAGARVAIERDRLAGALAVISCADVEARKMTVRELADAFGAEGCAKLLKDHAAIAQHALDGRTASEAIELVWPDSVAAARRNDCDW